MTDSDTPPDAIPGAPAYLAVTADQLGEGTDVRVRRRGDMADLAQDLAEVMLAEIADAAQQNRAATLIVPVGPVDQFPILAEMINQQRVDCRDVVLINMDEYLDDHDEWIDAAHPLSFRGYMDRLFYDLLDPDLAPKKENRVFPHPKEPDRIEAVIDQRGGLDACFGGIGINGHIAFNEPPEPNETISNEAFADLPTRALSLTRETRTINSVTVGGEIAIIPHRAVTVGMREILGARRLRFYCNRPWQSAVIRRVLHGPIEAACPASFLRTHPDASVTVADYVARPPDIALR
jgi:glucosamine-6-phosphate deaminase